MVDRFTEIDGAEFRKGHVIGNLNVIPSPRFIVGSLLAIRRGQSVWVGSHVGVDWLGYSGQQAKAAWPDANQINRRGSARTIDFSSPTAWSWMQEG